MSRREAGGSDLDKRYQIFVSSTFTDLKQERQAVLTAILEVDHTPAGMELFPAGDDSAWQLIKDVIDTSDYYVLLIGGRYGSLDETGLSFTEKEYEYAVSTNKPVIPLLHENPDNLPRDKTDIDEAAWEKLKSFRGKVEKRHTCVYWKTADELKAKVIVGLTAAIKRHPAVGWIRADKVPTEATLADLLSLRKRVAELEAQLETDAVRPPKGAEDLVQGEDAFTVNFHFTARRPVKSYPYHDDTSYTAHFDTSWNDIFASIAPSLINEASDTDLRASFDSFLESRAREEFKGDKDLKGRELINFKFEKDEIDTCIIQFRALGLIKESKRQRSVKDTQTYWTLTPYGDHLMTQLRAIRRIPPKAVRSRASASRSA